MEPVPQVQWYIFAATLYHSDPQVQWYIYAAILHHTVPQVRGWYIVAANLSHTRFLVVIYVYRRRILAFLDFRLFSHCIL